MSTLRVTGLKQETSTATNISLAVGGGVTVAGISTFHNTGEFGSGIHVSAGTIGIGTAVASSNSTLHSLTDNSTARIIAETLSVSGYPGYRMSNATGYWEMQVDGSNQGLRFLDDGTERIRVSAAGSFGIGASNPITKLEVQANDTTVYSPTDVPNRSKAVVRVINTDQTTQETYAGFSLQTFGDNTNSSRASIGLIKQGSGGSTGALVFGIRDSSFGNVLERLRINSAGKVGIGTDDPEEIVHILGPSEVVSERDGVMLQHSTPNANADTGLPIVWSGHIGTQNNYGLASICGRKENSNGGGDAAAYLQFATCNAAGSLEERARIDSDGRLYIGPTNDLEDSKNLLVTSRAKLGSIENTFVSGSTNSNNRTVLLHRLGQGKGFRFYGDFIVNSWTGNAAANLSMGVRYNTDAVVVDIINEYHHGTLGTQTNLRVITCTYDSQDYLGIQKVSGGTGTCHINAFVSTNIDEDGNGGIREVDNSNLTSVTEITKINYT